MLYSVELPFLKRVYYGKSDSIMTILEFADKVHTGEIYINEDYRYVFEDRKGLTKPKGEIPNAVIRELLFPKSTDEDFLLNKLITNARHILLSKPDPFGLMDIDGVQVRRKDYDMYCKFCLSEKACGMEELDRFRYNSHMH